MSEIAATESITSNANTVASTSEATELIAYQDVKEALDKWTIPKVKPDTIYKIGTFDFTSRKIIKTFEHAVSLQNNDEIIYLLQIQDLYPFMQKYKYVHIGLVQIAFKPLTLLGQNTSIQCTLRDGRCLNWKSSLMGAIETSLAHGPVYFNIYPNLSVSLSDSNLSKTLELRVLSHGYEYLPGSLPFAILYRLHLKVLSTLNPYTRKQTENGYTVLIDTNLFNSQVAVPKLIPWEDIIFPTQWTIPQAVPTRPIVRQSIEDVIQTQGGNVYLKFQKPLTLPRSFSSISQQSIQAYNIDFPESSRQSISGPTPTELGKQSSNESEKIQEDIVKGLHISENQIPHGIYIPNRRPDSPTATDMRFEI